MDKKHRELFEKLHKIYNKHRKKYRGNPDSNQLCCMWSTSDPPDVIFETAPHYDLENEFDISLNEDQILDLYNMELKEAVVLLSNIILQQKG
jgi:hypothetical protein